MFSDLSRTWCRVDLRGQPHLQAAQVEVYVNSWPLRSTAELILMPHLRWPRATFLPAVL
jgi:hypothetical protein